MMKRASSKKKVKNSGHASLASVAKMSLNGFKPVMWPTCLPVRLRFDDYRVLTAASNKSTYTYCLNSLYDPDATGTGLQPEGFDQLKTLYGRYRVVAVKVSVEAEGNGANTNGMLAMAPIDNSATTLDAESCAALRFGHGTTFTQTDPGRLSALWHIGELLGYTDESVLGNANLDAAIGANPTFQQFLRIQVETGNGATDQTMIRVSLEFYARMEVPIAVQDSVARRQRDARRAVAYAAYRQSGQVSADSTPTGVEPRLLSCTLPPLGKRDDVSSSETPVTVPAKALTQPTDESSYRLCTDVASPQTMIPPSRETCCAYCQK